MAKNQHVVPNNGGWAVKAEGNVKSSHTFSTQSQAIEKARELAKASNSELFVHNAKGQIRERNSYGKDPFPPKG